MKAGGCGGKSERTTMWNAETWGLLAWLIANTPIYLVIGRVVFGGWDGFFEAWGEHRLVIPNLANFRIWAFVLWVIATLAAEYYVFQRFFVR
jgi:hypothetical protein